MKKFQMKTAMEIGNCTYNMIHTRDVIAYNYKILAEQEKKYREEGERKGHEWVKINSVEFYCKLWNVLASLYSAREISKLNRDKLVGLIVDKNFRREINQEFRNMYDDNNLIFVILLRSIIQHQGTLDMGFYYDKTGETKILLRLKDAEGHKITRKLPSDFVQKKIMDVGGSRYIDISESIQTSYRLSYSFICWVERNTALQFKKKK